jgi:hypothetical protein
VRVTVRAGWRPDLERMEVGMDWWGWVILALVIIAVLVVLAVIVQRKRRRGGVIGLSKPSRGDSA